MGFNKANFRRIKNEYATKYLKAQEAASVRREEVEAAVPGLAELDWELSACGMEIMRAALGGGDVEAAVAEVRRKNEALQEKRRALLVSHGYPSDYSDVRYECPLCGDTGYVDFKMCVCMRRALIRAGYASSGLGDLLDKQTFDNFSLDYYRNSAEAYATMQLARDEMKKYAETFSVEEGKRPDNLLLMGGTGLGKTHLSTALAGVVIGKGFDVRYAGAVELVADFEQNRFGNSSAAGASGEDLENYYDCDLLILDDLGTEVANQFTVSCLHNVINVRLNRGLPTVISTNLTPSELRTRYWDRITSRLLGDYRMILFRGNDVRLQKARG